MKGPAAIMIAAILSLAFQPAMATAMTTSQCAHMTAMADAHVIASHGAGHESIPGSSHENNADKASCCSGDEAPGTHKCGDLCAIACASSLTADLPLSAAFAAGPVHPHHESHTRPPLLQFAAAFIPPPPRL